MARLTGEWKWGLRVTPALGVIAILLLFIIRDPARGEKEGGSHISSSSWLGDVKAIAKKFVLFIN